MQRMLPEPTGIDKNKNPNKNVNVSVKSVYYVNQVPKVLWGVPCSGAC